MCVGGMVEGEAGTGTGEAGTGMEGGMRESLPSGSGVRLEGTFWKGCIGKVTMIKSER